VALHALLLAARSVPRALKVTGLITGVLLGLSGGLATAAAIKANDVQNSYDRLTQATDGFAAGVLSEGPAEPAAAELRDVEGVDAVATLTVFEVAAFTTGEEPLALGPQPDDPCYTGAGDVAATPYTSGWRGRAPQMLLSDGRFPRADAREVVLPIVTARRLDLGVGDRIVFAGDCTNEEAGEFEKPIEVRISGLGTGVLDAPSLGANFALENLLISSRVAADLVESGARRDRASLVWLDDGVRPSELRELPEGSEVIFDMIETRDAVRGDLGPDATALRVFAAVVALSALVILGPVLGRLVRAANASGPTLRSLGMSRGWLLSIGIIRGAAVGVVAAIVSAAATIGFATRLPIGVARQYAGSIPFSPGGIRAFFGALLVAASTVAITSAVCWATLRQRRTAPMPRQAGWVGRSLSRLGLRPEWGAGVRSALEPGALDDPAPVRSGVTTAAVAVAAVVGVITFSSSLGHLRHTPRLFGMNWDAFAIVEDVEGLATALEADPEVEALARGTFFPPQGATLGDEAAEVWLMSFEAGPGRGKPTVVSGRAPASGHELLLARELSETTGAGIGDTTSLHIPTAETMLASQLDVPWNGAAERVTELVVVGIGVLPIGDGRVGMGASMTLDGLRSALGPPTSPALLDIVARASPEALTTAFQQNGDPTLTADDIGAMSDAELLSHLVEPLTPHMVVFDAGSAEKAAAKAIAASNGSLSNDDFAEKPTPEAVINLDLSQASRIPDTFSGLMAVIAIAVVTMLIATGGQRRRQDLATLRALGFGPRHVQRALIAQAMTTVLAASLLVPVGVALGRIAWVGYANGLGVVAEPMVPPSEIAAALGSLLAISLAVALITARFQVRVPLAAALRPRE
jgi:hypothetical protein